jgi:serine/threonine protein kinase
VVASEEDAMTDKPLCRAFVSSTYIDLKEHRARVIDALRKSGIHVDPMEDWTAEDREPKQFSQQLVNGCRLCILLVAFRRGYIPEGEMLSITQMEYEHAVRSGLAVLPFLLGDDEPWPRRFDEMEKDPGIGQWREQLRRKHGVGTFGFRPESLEVGPAVLRWLQQSNAEASPQHLTRLLQARADRNLLYGILALQMDFINRDALIRAMHAWVLEKTKTLGDLLREHGALTEEVHALVETLVRKHLEQHGHDVRESLAAVQPNAALAADLASLPDPQIQASVVSMQSQALDPLVPRLGATQAGEQTAPVSLRYRILGPHRCGGLGEVLIAHDEELGRKVALKQIRREYADHPVNRARFLLEAEITGGLEHPGIVPVYGLCAYPDGRPFYAMRFIHGESLREVIQAFHKAESPDRDPVERVLALRGLLNSFVAVCNAVAYANSRGVLHRDLKPANIMLGPYGETLVVDWGLAKLMAAESAPDAGQELLRPASASGSAPTQLGSDVGTPEYMAPEQTAGRSDSLGPHTDVYGLGAVLFEILTGRPPHDRHSRTPDPPRAQSVQPSTPAALDEIAARAMNPDPGDRYHNASGLAEAVQRWLAEEPVENYRGEVARAAALVLESRGDPKCIAELARNHVNLGLVYQGMGRASEAERELREAIRHYKTLVKGRPRFSGYLADLASTRLHLHHVLLSQGRTEDAERARVTAQAEYERLVRADPADRRHRRILENILAKSLTPEEIRRRQSALATAPDASGAATDGGTDEAEWATVFERLVVQHALIHLEQFLELCEAKATREELSIVDLMVDRGWLAPADRGEVDALIAAASIVRSPEVEIVSWLDDDEPPSSLIPLSSREPSADHELPSAVVPTSLPSEIPRQGDSSLEQTDLTARSGPLEDAEASLGPYETMVPERDESESLLDHPRLSGSTFLIIRPLATGGLGKLSVAYDELLGRQVVIKEVRHDLTDNQDARTRLLREATITASLQHPGIVPIYGVGELPDGRPFYTMPLVHGQSFRQAIERMHEMPPQAADRLAILRDLLERLAVVCDVVAYAHSRGVLHRDLKPANILIGDYGETIVIDWGLAKHQTSSTEELPSEGSAAPGWMKTDASETMTGHQMGTPAYMSPEQATGDVRGQSPASDVFCLGAILYHLLCGRAPFAGRGDDVREVLDLARTGQFPRPRTVNRQISPALESIILKAMARHAEERYSSAHILARDLRGWLADEPISVYAEPRWRRFVRRIQGRMP